MKNIIPHAVGFPLPAKPDNNIPSEGTSDPVYYDCYSVHYSKDIGKWFALWATNYKFTLIAETTISGKVIDLYEVIFFDSEKVILYSKMFDTYLTNNLPFLISHLNIKRKHLIIQ